MTCRGYDARAVRVPKSVKRMAANHMDPHYRGAFIRSYVRVLEEQNRQRTTRNRGDR
jgi:hypothetical protein